MSGRDLAPLLLVARTIRLLAVLVAFSVSIPAKTYAAGRILLFGGKDHDVYLGCFSCSKYERDSIFNQYGPYGSKYSAKSIWNRYGLYGSDFSPYSVCNPYATYPPVVVDEEGGFYGYLTLNQYHKFAINDPDIVAWLKNVVCAK